MVLQVDKYDYYDAEKFYEIVAELKRKNIDCTLHGVTQQGNDMGLSSCFFRDGKDKVIKGVKGWFSEQGNSEVYFERLYLIL